MNEDTLREEIAALVREIQGQTDEHDRPDTIVLPDTPFNRRLARRFRRWHRWRAFWRKVRGL